jgi:hypothetical protein
LEEYIASIFSVEEIIRQGPASKQVACLLAGFKTERNIVDINELFQIPL